MTHVRLSVRTRLTVWYTALLLAILVVISALTYSLLRRSLVKDLDASLRLVAQVVADTRLAGADPDEALIRRFFGPDFYDKLVQLLDPGGRTTARSSPLRGRALPLTPQAQDAAFRGAETFETLELADGELVRVLTVPLMRGGRPVRIIQVGMAFERVERALRHYLQTVFVLVPLGVALAAIGGAVLARSALSAVDAMSRTARRITAEALDERIAPTGTGDELDRLAATLNDMLGRLEAAFVELRRFAADAAHELRTPLTSLRGGIEVALRAGRTEEEYRAVLRSSLEEVERLIRLSEDLLLLSRFAGSVPPPRDPVELEPLVVEVFDLASRLAGTSGVSVRLGSMTPATVRGDGGALRRAILNLVDNAVKYTPRGGKVEIALAADRDEAVVTVHDTGPGIAPADVERIFHPFVRLDAATAVPGTGLGLPIARSIVEAHGGRIDVETQSGTGSTFVVRLPRTPV